MYSKIVHWHFKTIVVYSIVYIGCISVHEFKKIFPKILWTKYVVLIRACTQKSVKTRNCPKHLFKFKYLKRWSFYFRLFHIFLDPIVKLPDVCIITVLARSIAPYTPRDHAHQDPGVTVRQLDTQWPPAISVTGVTKKRALITRTKHGVREVSGPNVGVCADVAGNDRNVNVMDKLGSVLDVFVSLTTPNHAPHSFPPTPRQKQIVSNTGRFQTQRLHFFGEINRFVHFYKRNIVVITGPFCKLRVDDVPLDFSFDSVLSLTLIRAQNDVYVWLEKWALEFVWIMGETMGGRNNPGIWNQSASTKRLFLQMRFLLTNLYIPNHQMK